MVSRRVASSRIKSIRFGCNDEIVASEGRKPTTRNRKEARQGREEVPQGGAVARQAGLGLEADVALYGIRMDASVLPSISFSHTRIS